MNFLSIIYGLFLLSILGIYWSVRSPNLRLWTLLIVSLVFYASLQIQYIPLLLVITLINFRLGKAIGTTAAIGKQAKDHNLSNQDWQKFLVFWNRRRWQILCFGIFLNVALLVGFKYVPFILNNIAVPLNLPDAAKSAKWISDRLIAPLGISYFVFECIAYLIDVYRGATATPQLLKFTAYKLFFPKLIAGPITRYHQFANDGLGFQEKLQFPSVDIWAEGLWLISCGAFKKALIADRLAIFVDLCFNNLERAGSADLWLAIFAYGLQLYLDFSGYVDIARGSALLLGFNLPENFDFPYFSTNIADFWRRWHISLGDWLRNYLYFPLGGSRQGLARTCLNLIIIMLIAGIWHGAAWGYVIWGGLHGLALMIHRLTDALSQRFVWMRNCWQSLLGVALAWVLTQSMVFTSWVFFRLPDLKQANWVIQHLWDESGDIQFAQKVYKEALNLDRPQVALLVGGLALSMSIIYTFYRGLKIQLNWPIKLLLVPICLYAVWVLAPGGKLPFIYFDF